MKSGDILFHVGTSCSVALLVIIYTVVTDSYISGSTSLWQLGNPYKITQMASSKQGLPAPFKGGKGEDAARIFKRYETAYAINKWETEKNKASGHT